MTAGSTFIRGTRSWVAGVLVTVGTSSLDPARVMTGSPDIVPALPPWGVGWDLITSSS